jgi:hypothetical protein
MLDLIKTNAPVAAYETNAFAHGIGNSTVSSQWYNRPADQKFLSLTDMLAHKKADAAKVGKPHRQYSQNQSHWRF